ncbi:esterase [Hanstruepera neustonica]|uniref:Esterase n=1 Tax=Hanstruepera neustonica TaxID=1445657 RepID=A0A2K1DY43_9FLAO|nr:esterase [Hanstruepera neustonica]PNQ72930.1 esterase [Hanstruepera neustonica]
MHLSEKEISYQTTNSFSTLNSLTKKTKTVWFVCHGMGYLSRYFLRYFESLNADENYIIAPQAPSKYYIGPKFRHVGASWLTKENTSKETDNVMRYFDAVFESENIPSDKKFIILGYSQGVSVAMRYMAKRKLQPDQLILHSGGIPIELTSEDFSYFKGDVYLVYGDSDEYLNQDRIDQEIEKSKLLFGDKVAIMPFEGGHIVNTNLIKSISNQLSTN